MHGSAVLSGTGGGVGKAEGQDGAVSAQGDLRDVCRGQVECVNPHGIGRAGKLVRVTVSGGGGGTRAIAAAVKARLRELAGFSRAQDGRRIKVAGKRIRAAGTARVLTAAIVDVVVVVGIGPGRGVAGTIIPASEATFIVTSAIVDGGFVAVVAGLPVGAP